MSSYISQKGIQRLKEEYKYVSSDESLLTSLFLKRWWNWSVTFLPSNLAPNVVTMLGFVSLLPSLILSIYYAPTLTETQPWWVYVCSGIGIFLYATMDALDGKQARRTGSSGPLGELFDHGVDSLAIGFLMLRVLAIVQIGQSALTMLLGQIALVAFFFASWEYYLTGHMIFRKINPVVEGIHSAVVIELLMGAYVFFSGHGGVSAAVESTVTTGQALVVGIYMFMTDPSSDPSSFISRGTQALEVTLSTTTLLILVAIIAIFVQLGTSLLTGIQYVKSGVSTRPPQMKVNVSGAIFLSFPPILIFVLNTIWAFLVELNGSFSTHFFWVVMLACVFHFAWHTDFLILSCVSKSKVNVFQPMFYITHLVALLGILLEVAKLAQVNVLKFNVDAIAQAVFYLIVAVAMHLSFVVSVVRVLADALGVNVFSIKKKKAKVRVAKEAKGKGKVKKAKAVEKTDPEPVVWKSPRLRARSGKCVKCGHALDEERVCVECGFVTFILHK